MVTIKHGDLLEATEDIIAHQVNCFGVVGGLAADIFKKWPNAELDYLQLCQRAKPWSIRGLAQVTGQQKDGHIICNLFGQYHPGCDYNPEALESALFMLSDLAKTFNLTVALPFGLSCGIAGGTWSEVQKIIESTMKGVQCTVYMKVDAE